MPFVTTDTIHGKCAFVLFQDNLRLNFNQAFYKSCEHPYVFPFFVFPGDSQKFSLYGEASQLWLHGSLNSLDESLKNSLNIYQEPLGNLLPRLFHDYKPKYFFSTFSAHPLRKKIHDTIQQLCHDHNITFKIFYDNYLTNPQDIQNKSGGIYKVFTPYKNILLHHMEKKISQDISHGEVKNLLTTTKFLRDPKNPMTLESLGLGPQKSWAFSLERHCSPGESQGEKMVDDFLSKSLINYKENRNFPVLQGTSGLSAYLRFGEISPWLIVVKAREWLKNSPPGALENYLMFLSELCWRDFGTYLLHHFPQCLHNNMNEKFNIFPWKDNAPWLKMWQKGQTGYPFVDAAMRELWHTGFMHNRLRMVTASFLTKNLQIHWKHGEEWFWNCLFDGDKANNVMNWQWVAGCGVDAAPYFRIFNPVVQGKKFDPEGHYIAQWVPELKNLPKKYIHEPWTAPESLLGEKNILLGKTYPYPMVPLRESQKKALESYKQMTKSLNYGL